MRGRPGLPVSVRVIRVGAKRRRIARSLPAQHALAAADAIVAVDDGRVAPRSAVDEVARAVDRRQPVDAGTAEQPVGVQAAGEAVVAGAAAQDVAPAAALELVVAGAAVEPVVALAAEEQVVAGETADHVITALALEVVDDRRPGDRVVAAAPEHEEAERSR